MTNENDKEKGNIVNDPKKKINVGANNDNAKEVKPMWYIFRVQTGREDDIINSLKSSFSILAKDGINGNDYFKDFSVPKYQYTKYVNGKAVTKVANAYGGYIFLKIKMTDIIVSFLRNFFRNNGFGQMLPRPITDEEYKRTIEKAESLSKDAKEFKFKVGQRIKINSGSFAAMEGSICSIDEVNRKLCVSVMIFNCETKIDIEYDQVSIIE